MAGITDIITELGTLLTGIAPIVFGKNAASQNLAPPLYSVFPRSEQYGQPEGPGQSANPRILHSRRVELEVHSWGTDYANAEALNQAFVSAMRKALSGFNYRLNQAEWIDPEPGELGATIVLSFTLQMAMPNTALPLLQDDTSPTVTITNVEVDT